MFNMMADYCVCMFFDLLSLRYRLAVRSFNQRCVQLVRTGAFHRFTTTLGIMRPLVGQD